MKAFNFSNTSTPDRSIAKRLIEISRRNFLPLVVLGTATLQILLLVQTGLLTIWVAKLTRKPPPVLVELAEGRTVTVTPAKPLYRSPDSIKQFVASKMVPLFSWSGILPPRVGSEIQTTKSDRDPGVSINSKGLSDRKVTTPAWEASFALSESFRSTFVEKLAELTPRSIFLGSTRTLLVVNHISEPEELEPGQWQLNLIANLITFTSQDKIGSAVPFNKTIYVRAVYPQPPMERGDKESPESALYHARQAGLEIYRISDLQK